MIWLSLAADSLATTCGSCLLFCRLKGSCHNGIAAAVTASCGNLKDVAWDAVDITDHLCLPDCFFSIHNWAYVIYNQLGYPIPN